MAIYNEAQNQSLKSQRLWNAHETRAVDNSGRTEANSNVYPLVETLDQEAPGRYFVVCTKRSALMGPLDRHESLLEGATGNRHGYLSLNNPHPAWNTGPLNELQGRPQRPLIPDIPERRALFDSTGLPQPSPISRRFVKSCIVQESSRINIRLPRALMPTVELSSAPPKQAPSPISQMCCPAGHRLAAQARRADQVERRPRPSLVTQSQYSCEATTWRGLTENRGPKSKRSNPDILVHHNTNHKPSILQTPIDLLQPIIDEVFNDDSANESLSANVPLKREIRGDDESEKKGHKKTRELPFLIDTKKNNSSTTDLNQPLCNPLAKAISTNKRSIQNTRPLRSLLETTEANISSSNTIISQPLDYTKDISPTYQFIQLEGSEPVETVILTPPKHTKDNNIAAKAAYSRARFAPSPKATRQGTASLKTDSRLT